MCSKREHGGKNEGKGKSKWKKKTNSEENFTRRQILKKLQKKKKEKGAKSTATTTKMCRRNATMKTNKKGAVPIVCDYSVFTRVKRAWYNGVTKTHGETNNAIGNMRRIRLSLFVASPLNPNQNATMLMPSLLYYLSQISELVVSLRIYSHNLHATKMVITTFDDVLTDCLLGGF